MESNELIVCRDVSLGYEGKPLLQQVHPDEGPTGIAVPPVR